MFNKRLKEFFDENNLTPKGVAAQMNVSVDRIETYLNGKRNPKIEWLESFSNMYHADLNYLITGEKCVCTIQDFLKETYGWSDVKIEKFTEEYLNCETTSDLVDIFLRAKAGNKEDVEIITSIVNTYNKKYILGN